MSEVHGAGPEKKDVIFRTKPGFEWIGMKPDIEPQDLPENTPRVLQNMRLMGGRIESRGGQEQVCNIGNKITGLFDFNPGNPPGLTISGYGMNLGNPLSQIYGSVSRHNRDTGLLEILEFPENLPQAGYLGTCAGVLYYISESTTAKAEVYSLLGNNSFQKLFTLPTNADGNGNGWMPFLSDHNGTLLIGASSGLGVTTTRQIYKFDGYTLTTDKIFKLAAEHRWPAVDGVKFRDKLVVGFAHGTGYVNPVSGIEVRSSDGTWARITAASGNPAMNYRMKRTCASFRDRLYIPNGLTTSTGFSPDIFSFDGTSLTRYQPATTGVDNTSTRAVILSCVTHLGNLYYLWADFDVTGLTTKLRIGKFDGTVWSPDHVNILSKFPSLTFNGIDDQRYAMLSSQGRMFVCVPKIETLQNSMSIMQSPIGPDISGTWTEILEHNTPSNPTLYGIQAF